MFSASVHAFIDKHWDAVPAAQRTSHWADATRATGWQVPLWPSGAGGPGWNATRKYIWSSALAQRGVLLPPNPGVDVVGPLLAAAAPEAMQALLLPDIREDRVSWCVAAAEADGIDLEGMQTRVDEVAGGYRLSGQKHFVWGGMGAQWLLCLARFGAGFGLFALPLDDAGVTRTSQATFDGGQPLAVITFSDVFVPHELGCAIADPEDALSRLGGMAHLATGAVAAGQLTAITQVVAPWQDADLNDRINELGVAVAALQAMEARYVEAQARAAQAPFPLAAMRARGREILLQLGDLQMQSFGYYALPYPDEALLHNEGPIGPAGTTAALRRNLAARLALQHEAVTSRSEDWKDELARHLAVNKEEQ